MKETLLKFFSAITILLCITDGRASAQTGAGTVTLINTTVNTASGDITYIFSDSLFIGPDAVMNISGTLVFYGRYIWIAPTALIEQNGVGVIHIENPEDNPFYPDMPAGPTTIDGNNGHPIGSIVFHLNPHNIILADIIDPGFGTTNPPGALAAALNLGNSFLFYIEQGDIILNGNDLIVNRSGGATGLLSGFSAANMVVTGNSTAGHLVILNGGNSSSFTFPVGIAEGDFTPVLISGSGDYYVSVVDYASAIPLINRPSEGMGRTWHIYGGSAAEVYLQHNSPITDGANYTDTEAFITRYAGNGIWSTGTTDWVGTGLHRNTGSIATGIPGSGTTDGAWLTKTSDAITPLPVELINFYVKKNGTVADLTWATASEQNNKGFFVERSTDGRSWEKIGFVNSKALNGNNTTRLDYMFSDLEPAKRTNYYRLQQVDIDGNYDYSEVRTIKFESDIVIYPNPVLNSVFVKGLPHYATVNIFTATGQLINKITVDTGSLEIDMGKLPPGIYYFTINDTSDKTILTKKILKK